MERYVAQLIEDLQAAHTIKIPAIYTASGDEAIKGSFEKFFGIESISLSYLPKLSD